MVLDLDNVKKHLNIDLSYTDDDEYITHLCLVAEDAIAKDIDISLEEVAAQNDGTLPEGLKHAMYLFVGDLYANRESVAYTNAVSVPHSLQYLIDLYKQY